VVKLLRAHGGCLGTRSRRRTWEPAISAGELATKLRSGDIRMGKPGGSHVPSPSPEHIGCRRERGEVKHLSTHRKRKQPVIPRVVASEIGRGQTVYA